MTWEYYVAGNFLIRVSYQGNQAAERKQVADLVGTDLPIRPATPEEINVWGWSPEPVQPMSWRPGQIVVMNGRRFRILFFDGSNWIGMPVGKPGVRIALDLPDSVANGTGSVPINHKESGK